MSMTIDQARALRAFGAGHPELTTDAARAETINARVWRCKAGVDFITWTSVENRLPAGHAGLLRLGFAAVLGQAKAAAEAAPADAAAQAQYGSLLNIADCLAGPGVDVRCAAFQERGPAVLSAAAQAAGLAGVDQTILDWGRDYEPYVLGRPAVAEDFPAAAALAAAGDRVESLAAGLLKGLNDVCNVWLANPESRAEPTKEELVALIP